MTSACFGAEIDVTKMKKQNKTKKTLASVLMELFWASG